MVEKFKAGEWPTIAVTRVAVEPDIQSALGQTSADIEGHGQFARSKRRDLATQQEFMA
jgi:hypothetical protein